MNAMGFSADGLGNHNFDRGSTNSWSIKLAPIAEFPYLSANLTDERGRRPDAWQPSATFEVDGVTVAIVGFSNPDIPNLVFPGGLGPYQVGDPVAAVNSEAERLRGEGVDAVVAMGHMGATAGIGANPTGPVVRPGRRRDRRRCRDRRPHRHPGFDDPPERRPPHRERQQGRQVHPRPPCDRQGVGRRWSTRPPTSTGRGSRALRRTRISRPAWTNSTPRRRRFWKRRSGRRRWPSHGPTPAVPKTAAPARACSATWSPTRCGRPTTPTSRSPTPAVSARI